MKERQEQLEGLLLKNPFNHDLRAEYALQLYELGDYSGSLEQFRLVAQGMPDHATGFLGMARCLARVDRNKEALNAYTSAKALEGFSPVAELEQLAASAATARPALKVIEGDLRESNVVAFGQGQGEAIRFSDIVGMDAVKKTLKLQIIEPFLRPGLFSRFKKKSGGGVLLYGPPGCGKTMMARAIASECNAQFIAVGISDVLIMWRGESERNLALIFEKARANRPCVLFFDELDALAFSRAKAVSEHSRTIVNEFLSQLDGFNQNNEGVLILAATNMPWDVDAAMKRPGRFSRQIFVPPPDAAARRAMYEIKLADVPAEGVKIAKLAKASDLFSGADIDGVIDAAKEVVLTDILESGRERPLNHQDFETALQQVQPSTIDWLKTARNLVKYAGADASYRDVEKYLKSVKVL